MNPTDAEVAARLNPQASSVSIPTTGLWRSQGDYGTTLYKTNPDGGTVAIDLLAIGKQQNPNAQNAGEQANAALQYLKTAYGLDYNSLPLVNYGDFIQQQNKGPNALKWAQQFGPSGYRVGTDTLENVIGTPPAQIQQEAVNTQPNAIATPTQMAAATTATNSALAADQGKNIQTTTDTTGNITAETATPVTPIAPTPPVATSTVAAPAQAATPAATPPTQTASTPPIAAVNTGDLSVGQQTPAQIAATVAVTGQQPVAQTAVAQPATTQSNAIANAPTSIGVSVQAPTSILQPGMTGDAVKQLQDYLVSKGYLTQEQKNTGYGTYGPQTTAAVAALQKDLGVNNSSGVGYFGPLTLSALQQNPSVTASTTNQTSTAGGTTPTETPVSGSSASNSTAAGTGLTFDSNYGVTTDQWSQMNDPQRAIVAAAYTAKQTAYNTNGQQMTFSDALTQAAQDPNIVAKYADAAKLDAQSFAQNLQQLQQNSTIDAQNKQMQFENDRKALAEQSAAKGQAYSGFRNLAQEQLGKQEQGIVQSSRATLQQNLNNATQAFEGKYGTSATNPATASFNDPYAASGISLSGQYNPNASGQIGLSGQLAGGITGSQPIAKQSDINTKATSLYNTVNATPTFA